MTMATVRLNAFVFKALSNTSIHGYTLSTRQFAKTSSAKKEDEKIQKLLKRYPDPSKPKRPLTSYLRFGADYRKSNKLEKFSKETISSYSSQIANAWKSLPEQQKASYSQQSATEWEKYKTTMENYKNSKKPELWSEKILKLSKVKPPQSGYQLFLQKTLPKTKDFAMTAKEWGRLDAEEKKRWSEKAKTSYTEWEGKMKK